MDFALAFLSVALIVLSLYGVLLPVRLLRMVDNVASGKAGLLCAVVVRFVFAALLWINAQDSYTPATFKVLSILLLLSAVTHFVVGRNLLEKFRHMLADLPLWAIRLPCLFGGAMGMFVIWSLSGVINIV